MIVAFFGGIASFLFWDAENSASISPYHMYPKICASPFGLHGELTRRLLHSSTNLLSKRLYEVMWSSLADKVLKCTELFFF